MSKFEIILLGALIVAQPLLAANKDADQLLKAADEVRNPAESYKMRIEVKTSSTEQEFEVSIKGQEKTLVVLKKPAKDIGRNMLMLDRDFYSYIPNLKRSVRLSLMQKMAGEVANGDIARTRWHGDYKASIERTDGNMTVLFLDGTKPNLTYQKIRLWVETASSKPKKAEYLGLDGKTTLKRATYGEYKNLAGAMRPTELKIEDLAGKASTIRILKMESAEFSDSLFSSSSLEKVR